MGLDTNEQGIRGREEVIGSDAISKLIKRAQEFRESLISASSRTDYSLDSESEFVVCKNGMEAGLSEGNSVPTIDKLLDSLLIDEAGEDDDILKYDFLEEDGRSDVGEAALLEELFFSKSISTSNIVQKNTPTKQHFVAEGTCLSLAIGKLVLSEPRVKDFTKMKPSVLGHMSSTATIPGCISMLTLSFPAICAADGSTLCPEQQISISPLSFRKRCLLFEHRSQLYWKLPAGKAQDKWWVQSVKATVYTKWHSGEALECYGYIPLKNAAVAASQTSLVLVGGKDGEEKLPADKVNQSTELRRKGNAAPAGMDFEGKPVAIADIGLVLQYSSVEAQQAPPSKKQEKQPEKQGLRPWLYVNLQSFVSFFSSLETRREAVTGTSMRLVVKSGSTIQYKGFPEQHKCYLDAVLELASDSECSVFLEVWRSWQAYLGSTEGLEGLVGMVKIPYSLETWKERKGTVKFSGKFSVWHPNKKSIHGKVPAVVTLGSRCQVLSLQRANQAATAIQCYIRRFLSCKKRVVFADVTSRSQTIRQGEMSWHTFEVSVHKLLGLPRDAEPLSNGKVFIKYMFPGEVEPLYTPEIEWLPVVKFDASVHHRVGLLCEKDVVLYLKGIDKAGEGLRFEVWQTDADSSSDSEKSGKGFVEQHFGTAVLCQESLFDLVDTRKRDTSENQKVKQLFELPVSIHGSWSRKLVVNLKLVVEAVYHYVHFSEHLLKGSIFEELFGEGPIEAVLEINIIKAKGLQAFVDTSWSKRKEGSVNSYVRFSLFPSDRNLELLYPPCITPFKVNSCNPYYGWKCTMLITLTAAVLREMSNSKMNFEIWHHSQKVRKDSALKWKSTSAATEIETETETESDTDTDIWLSTATAKCSTLLQEKNGVDEWLTLLSRKGEISGKLRVDIRFTSWQRASDR